ncbi:MAG TPA: RDD family protein [Gaiellaceae bacterium]|nr:RDD family protein [Gaiellaceae bacterium]
MSRFGIGAGRLVLRPTRAMAGDMLEPVAEAAVDRALAGPLPEAMARSLVEHHVIERVTREVLASADFQAAVGSALEDEGTARFLAEAMQSKLTARLAEQLLKGPEFERLLTEVLSSPAVSAALAKQTTTIGDEMVGSVRDATVELDTRLERRPRHWFHRAARPEANPPTPYAGFGSRGAALVIDAFVAQAFFLVGTGMVALVASLGGGISSHWIAGVLAAIGFVIVQVAYFAGSWTVVGRTPGMHLLGLRVQCSDGGRPGALRAVVRLVGLWLAIAIACLGFAPVFVDDRRRALQDFLAGTEVVYADA